MCMLKKIIPHILTPLRHICNTSLSQGVFPDEMKIARIIPLFKSGDKQNVSNYRPISLLPQFSKILEKIFNNRLMNFLNSNNLLYLRQYGFRKNMSTSMAIMELVENITNAMDNGKFTIGVFIDLKKAFDTVEFRVGVNSAPELDFLVNSKSNSGIGIELELALPSPGGIGIELELP